MKKLMLAAAVASAVFAAPVFAADLPASEPMMAAPSFSWSGAYVGAFAGAAFSDRRVRVTDRDGYTALAGTSFKHTLSDPFVGGLTLGYNAQVESFVLGVEGELGYLDIDNKGTDPSSTSRAKSRVEFGQVYGTLTGRAGVAFDRFLIFGKAGVAYLDTEGGYRDTCSIAPCGASLIDAKKNGDEWHWTVGAGAEYAVTDALSIKGEYNYIDTGQTLNVGGVATIAGAPIGSFRLTTKVPDLHIVKVDVNYRFY